MVLSVAENFAPGTSIILFLQTAFLDIRPKGGRTLQRSPPVVSDSGGGFVGCGRFCNDFVSATLPLQVL